MLEIELHDPSTHGYEMLVPVYNAVHTLWPSSVEEIERWDGYRNPSRDFQRLLGYVSGRLLFVGEAGHSEHIHRRGRRMLSHNGLEETNGTALEREYFQRLVDHVLASDPYELTTTIQSTQTTVVNLFYEWGFELRQRERVSKLEVQDFAPEHWRRPFEKLQDSGIELVSVLDLNIEDDEVVRELYEMADELFRDVPQPDSHVMDSFEVYARRIRTSPYDPRLRWYARKDGKMIGQTVIINNLADTRIGYTGLTAVRREYRRFGVASALKVQSLTKAKEIGMTMVQTENEENNPMFDLNVQLGFTEFMSWFQMGKSIREPNEEDLRQD